MAPPMPFRAFIKTPYPTGMGTDLDIVKKQCTGDEEALVALDRALRGKHGRTNAPRDPKTGRLLPEKNNVIHKEERNFASGNSAQGGLRRLDKAAQAGDEKAADLLRQVTDPANPKTVHRACIEMGWRQETITVPVDTLCDTTIRRIGALHTVQQAWHKADQSERSAITAWLDQQ